MNIGFFILRDYESIVDNYIESCLKIFNKENEIKIKIYSVNETPYTSRINSNLRADPFNSLKNLNEVYKISKKNNYDYAIVSFGSALPLKPKKIIELLKSESIKKNIWSFRISSISGTGMKNPSRLPFVDDHFIILNINQASKKQFFSRKLISSSHFSEVGYNSAVLLSMIEYSVKKDELNNHFKENFSRDSFGNLSDLNPVPFHLCENTGFLCIYPELNYRLKKILDFNLNDNKNLSFFSFLKERRGYYYRLFSFQNYFKKMKRFFTPNIENLIPQKKHR